MSGRKKILVALAALVGLAVATMCALATATDCCSDSRRPAPIVTATILPEPGWTD